MNSNFNGIFESFFYSFGFILLLLWIHSSITLDSFFYYSGFILLLLWIHSSITLDSFFYYSGFILLLLWIHSSNPSDSFFYSFGFILLLLWIHSSIPTYSKYSVKYKVNKLNYVKNTFQKLEILFEFVRINVLKIALFKRRNLYMSFFLKNA